MKAIIAENKCVRCQVEFEQDSLLRVPESYPDKRVNFGDLCDTCDGSISDVERGFFNSQISEFSALHVQRMMQDGTVLADLQQEVDAAKE